MTRAQSNPSVSTTACRFRPTTFFPRVVAAWSGLLGRLYALAVEDRSRRLRRMTRFLPHTFAQLGMNQFPGAVLLPGTEIVKHDSIGRQVVGQGSPRAAIADQIPDRVHDFATRVLRGT